MKKLESSFMNMVLSLTGFTLVAGALLAYVNKITAEPIKKAEADKLSKAIELVVPGFDNNPAAESDTIKIDKDTYIVYRATKNGEFIGAAVKSSANGFGGPLSVLVGFDSEGKIIDYSLLSHAETPGLGSKAADWFKKGGKGDITGKNPGEKALTVSKDKGDIDAITASTITSRAFLSAINNAYKIYKNINVDAASGVTKESAKEVAAEPTDSVCVKAETTVENK